MGLGRPVVLLLGRGSIPTCSLREQLERQGLSAITETHAGTAVPDAIVAWAASIPRIHRHRHVDLRWSSVPVLAITEQVADLVTLMKAEVQDFVAVERVREELFPRTMLLLRRKEAEESAVPLRYHEGVRLQAEALALCAHDMRSPLNVLQGYTRMLQRGHYGELSPEQRRVVETVDRQGQRLLEIIKVVVHKRRAAARLLEEMVPPSLPPPPATSRREADEVAARDQGQR